MASFFILKARIRTDKKGINMITGKRIRIIRSMRDLTQKELGLRTGFTNVNCDIRIGQYESGARTPKRDIKNRLASALQVDPAAISEPCFNSRHDIMHAMFMLDDMYEPIVKQTYNGNIAIVFTPEMHLYEGMSDWEYLKRLLESGEITRDDYHHLKYTYDSLLLKK